MVASLERTYPTKALLAFVGLPASTYYYHRARAAKEDKYATRRQLIKEIFDEARGRYGHRRVRIELAKRHSIRMSGKTVLREMTQSGCICRIRRRKYQSYKGEAGKTAPNVLKRNFRAKKPNTKWGTDVTEFKVAGRKIYLSPVIDMFNGEIVSYKVSSSPSMAMVTDMLKEALGRLGPQDRPILHSDQGWQYQNLAYRRLLDTHGLKQSMSRKGNCAGRELLRTPQRRVLPPPALRLSHRVHSRAGQLHPLVQPPPNQREAKRPQSCAVPQATPGNQPLVELSMAVLTGRLPVELKLSCQIPVWFG